MKKSSNLKKSIAQYVRKSTPAGLPKVAKFTEGYIQSLLMSENIETAFDRLESCSGFGIRVSTEFNEDTQELDYTYALEDSFHFVLRDFCSTVGFVYKPEYKEPIVRSLIRKDIAFYEWFFTFYLGLPVLYTKLLRSGTDITITRTDDEDGNQVFTVNRDKEGFSDEGIFTDISVSGYLSLNVYFEEGLDSEEERKKRKDGILNTLNLNKELLSLILPARLFVFFLFINNEESYHKIELGEFFEGVIQHHFYYDETHKYNGVVKYKSPIQFNLEEVGNATM